MNERRVPNVEKVQNMKIKQKLKPKHACVRAYMPVWTGQLFCISASQKIEPIFDALQCNFFVFFFRKKDCFDGLLNNRSRNILTRSGFLLVFSVDGISPLGAVDSSQPDENPCEGEEKSTEGVEPTRTEGFKGRQGDTGTKGGEDVAEDIVSGNDLSTPAFRLHHIEAIGVQARHAEKLGHTLYEHGDDGDGDSTNFLL